MSVGLLTLCRVVQTNDETQLFVNTPDGPAHVYGEGPYGLRQLYAKAPSRAQAIEAAAITHRDWLQSRSVTGYARTIETIDALSYLYYDGAWPAQPMAVVYIDPYPERPTHPGDIRVDRRQNPRRRVGA